MSFLDFLPLFKKLFLILQVLRHVKLCDEIVLHSLRNRKTMHEQYNYISERISMTEKLHVNQPNGIICVKAKFKQHTQKQTR